MSAVMPTSTVATAKAPAPFAPATSTMPGENPNSARTAIVGGTADQRGIAIARQRDRIAL
jgi:hypothetical protein